MCETSKALVGNPKCFCIPVIHGHVHFPDDNNMLQGMWSEIFQLLLFVLMPLESSPFPHGVEHPVLLPALSQYSYQKETQTVGSRGAALSSSLW